MLHHSGRSRTRYEDVFRAVGNYLDQNAFVEVVIVETPQGFLIKGQVFQRESRFDDAPLDLETFLLSDDDIDQILEESYRRRSRKE